MYKVGDIINPLAKVGLTIEFFNEHDTLFFNLGGMECVTNGEYRFPFFKKRFLLLLA